MQDVHTQTLLAAEPLTLLPYYTSGAVLCSWILSAELSLLSVTSRVRITSAILNSFHKQYCKSHSSNLAFCTSARSCLRGQLLLEVMGRVPDPSV